MSDETTKEYKEIDEKRGELSPIFARMEADEKLYFLEAYKMKRLPPRHAEAMPGVRNITLNDPLIFGNKGIAVMSAASMQTVVSGKKLKDPQTTLIEQYLADVFFMIDEGLPKRNIPGLEPFLNEQICLRGRWGARCCLRIDKTGRFIPDVLPIDGKCFANDTDGDEQLWGAHWYNQRKSQLEREYNKPGDKAFTISSDEVEVIDRWDKEVNTVFVDKQIVRVQPNPYGYVNFVFANCPIGSFISSSLAEAHRGESLFWADRDLWDYKNEVTTILLTMTINALFGALQFPNPAGGQAAKPDVSPFEPHTVHPIPKDAEYKPIPMSDIKSATRLLYSVLETALQRGSVAAIDYGTLTFPLSSLAITRLTASRDDQFLPRVNAKALFYQALSKMIISQTIQLGQTVEIDGAGEKTKYTKKDLDGEYKIEYQFRTTSPEQRIADIQIATAARGILSDDTIRRDIIKLSNPDGEDVKIKSDQAEKVDEVLFLFRRGEALLKPKDGEEPEVAQQIEAKILAGRIKTILRQRRQMGALSDIEGKAQPEPQTKPQELVPLTNEGRGGRVAPPPSPGEKASPEKESEGEHETEL